MYVSKTQNKTLTETCLRRKNKGTVNFKTGRFDNIDSTVIISSVSKAVQKASAALLTLLITAAESMLSKRPVLKVIVLLFFLLK